MPSSALSNIQAYKKPILDVCDLNALVEGRHSQPHAILGMHAISNAPQIGNIQFVIRAFLSGVKACWAENKNTKKRYPLHLIHAFGLFEGIITDQTDFFEYLLYIEYLDGSSHTCRDPYSFLPSISDEDLYLIGEGNHHHSYDKLGSHVRILNGVTGIAFTVWAPNAKRVSVVGDFNHWDGRYYPMRSMGASGIWELFIPHLGTQVRYKYEIITQENHLLLKTDPYGICFESSPHHASITYDITDYKWQDQSWMATRKIKNYLQEPISIYEVHLGSWKRITEDGNRPLTYREAAHELAAYAKKMGFTHIEFLPLAEHPFDGSWGYQVTGFFAPTQRYGTPHDFMYMVDILHQNGIGVILDWVPAHFPKDSFALANFDGTHLYNHADPKQGEHQDWGTLIFNYGRPEVSGFLIASALSWLDRFHIDGLRVDAVASMLYLDYSRNEGEWIPNSHGGKENIEAIAFLKKMNYVVHHYYPGCMTIAEESTAWQGVTLPLSGGGLGFDFKWNMGWMHDIKKYLSKDPIHRKYFHDNLTFGMLYQYTENFMSVFSHDEVVHGKGSMFSSIGSWNPYDKAQTLRALYAYMWLWPGKKTLFMGCEFGQQAEWRYDASLDWHLLEVHYPYHLGIQTLVKDLNHLYLQNSILGYQDQKQKGFEWIKVHDCDNSAIAFLRTGENPDNTFLAISNFTPVSRYNYHLGVPHSGYWEEIINTNATIYGGSGEGNCGGKYSLDTPCDHRPFSLELTLPGLSTLVLRYNTV